MHKQLQQMARNTQWLAKRLKHPGRRLQDIAQRVDGLEQRLHQSQHNELRHAAARLATLRARLERQTPAHRLTLLQARRSDLMRRLQTAMDHAFHRFYRRLGEAAHALDTVSPLATLGRGYAIITAADGRILRSTSDTAPNQRIQARLGHGRLSCRVEYLHDE